MNEELLILIGMGTLVLTLLAILWLTVSGHLRSPKAPARQGPVSIAHGLGRAARVFVFLAVGVGGLGFFALGPVGIFAAGGCLSLAVVMWIISACFK